MANVVIEPQPDGYPFIGRTGKGDMRSTHEYGQIRLAKGETKLIVEMEAYRLLLDAADELARLQLQLNGLFDELNATETDDDSRRWLGYVLNRLEAVAGTNAERTKDD